MRWRALLEPDARRSRPRPAFEQPSECALVRRRKIGGPGEIERLAPASPIASAEVGCARTSRPWWRGPGDHDPCELRGNALGASEVQEKEPCHGASNPSSNGSARPEPVGTRCRGTGPPAGSPTLVRTSTTRPPRAGSRRGTRLGRARSVEERVHHPGRRRRPRVRPPPCRHLEGGNRLHQFTAEVWQHAIAEEPDLLVAILAPELEHHVRAAGVAVFLDRRDAVGRRARRSACTCRAARP